MLRQEVERGAQGILNRVNEICFNASPLRELRAIAWIERHGGAGHVRLHRIDGTSEMVDLTASSKLDAEWAYLTMLFERGRACAERWLDGHFRDIGKKAVPIPPRAARRP